VRRKDLRTIQGRTIQKLRTVGVIAVRVPQTPSPQSGANNSEALSTARMGRPAVQPAARPRPPKRCPRASLAPTAT
jgi:hypothetical protein